MLPSSMPSVRERRRGKAQPGAGLGDPLPLEQLGGSLRASHLLLLLAEGFVVFSGLCGAGFARCRYTAQPGKACQKAEKAELLRQLCWQQPGVVVIPG